MGGQAIAIPQFCQFPALLHSKNPASGSFPLLAPALDMLFRPEQQHGTSGKDDVVVPMPGGHRNMDDSFILVESTVFDR